MIAIDTSALMAIALEEPEASACADALQAATDVLIAAPTLAETLIVSAGRGVAVEMSRLIDRLAITVVIADANTARRVAAIYSRWGKGVHPAALNFCDCFAYDVAREHGVSLLFVGKDFPRTDIEAAI